MTKSEKAETLERQKQLAQQAAESAQATVDDIEEQLRREKTADPTHQHMLEVEQQIAHGESQVLILRGRIALIEADLGAMRKHLSILRSLQGKTNGMAN